VNPFDDVPYGSGGPVPWFIATLRLARDRLIR